MLSLEEKERVQRIISKMEEMSKSISEQPQKQKKETLQKIFEGIKKIEKISLSIEQSERLYNLLRISEIDQIYKKSQKTGDVLYMDIQLYRGKVQIKYLKTIDSNLNEYQNIEELKKIRNTIQPIASISMLGKSIQNKIDNRIILLKRTSMKVESEAQNENLTKIYENLMDGTANLEVIKTLFQEEVKKY